MQLLETVLVPFVDNKDSIIHESRPHKLVFYDTHLEYFQWHKTNDVDEETQIRRDFFVDLTVMFKKDKLTALSYGYTNKDELYIIEMADSAGSVKMRFANKSDGRAIYEKIKNWWIDATS